MPANNSGALMGYLAAKHGHLGHLYSPGSQRVPFHFLPYALDNGRFSQGERWTEDNYISLLEWAKASGQDPLWALVPDVVGDREGTIAEWHRWAPRVSRYGWPLAFAVQDGMNHSDVPKEAAVVFVGGTTKWKIATLPWWSCFFPRVHVGRVNTGKRLKLCLKYGVESIDGIGWFRSPEQKQALLDYLQTTKELKTDDRINLFKGDD